jgi:hypothetical protein
MKRSALAIALLLLTSPCRADERAPLACSPDRPTVASGEDRTLTLRAWLASPAPLIWKADPGILKGSGPEVEWDLSGVAVGPHTARVAIAGTDEPCAIEVRVLGRARGGIESGAAYLLTGREEAKGYGLYSYLLFAMRPTAHSHERYLAAIETYLKAVPAIVALEAAGIAAHRLNATFLPLTSRPAPSVQNAKDQPSADWLLAHYDYARAHAILAALPGEYLSSGPYVVSALAPLGRVRTIEGHYLHQDLSSVPSRIVGLWAREFFSQAAQERFWEDRTGRQLALRMRTTVAVLAEAYPGIKDEVQSLIGWIKGT